MYIKFVVFFSFSDVNNDEVGLLLENNIYIHTYTQLDVRRYACVCMQIFG